MNRRQLLLAGAGSLIGLAAAPLAARGSQRPVDLIMAPTNLGLRPSDTDTIPGTDHAAQVLMEAGLPQAIPFRRTETLTQLPYSRDAEPGTRLRNGSKIRRFNLEMADAVARSRRSGGFPLVIGGECSDLLGGLLGLRRAGGRGLVHLDGHSDFLTPQIYPPSRPLHAAAGMDLALATGRGEPLLTMWPGISGPLAQDADTVQLGERYSNPPEAPIGLFAGTALTQITVQRAQRIGIAAAAGEIAAHLQRRRIIAAWLHIDTDILDQSAMPAVDSPGTPGLSFAELTELIGLLLRTGRIGGADVAIYDPDLDPDRRYAQAIVACLGQAFAPLSH
jgi:arginase